MWSVLGRWPCLTCAGKSTSEVLRCFLLPGEFVVLAHVSSRLACSSHPGKPVT